MSSNKNFSGFLYSSFRATYGPFIGVIGFILMFVGYYVVPGTEKVELRHVLLISSIGIYLIFLAFHSAYTAFVEERNYLPDVRYTSEAPRSYTSSVALMLLEPSKLFSYDAVVAIYQKKDEIEHLVGLGRVINIQENGNIQILVTHDLEYAEEWVDFKKNNATTLKKLLVKPTVPAFAMEAVING